MEYKRQTGIAFIIAENNDGTYVVNMGTNTAMPQDGLPLFLYADIIQAVCSCVDRHNKKRKEDKQ